MKKLTYVFALAFAVALTACDPKPATNNEGGDNVTATPTEQATEQPATSANATACSCPAGECKCSANEDCGAGCGAEKKEACTEKKEACANAGACCKDKKEACDNEGACANTPA